MKEEDLVRRRLRRQYLIGTPLATPEAVVAWLGAVQAQELAVAKWGVAQRTAGAITEARMDRALAEGRSCAPTCCGPPGTSSCRPTSAG